MVLLIFDSKHKENIQKVIENNKKIIKKNKKKQKINSKTYEKLKKQKTKKQFWRVHQADAYNLFGRKRTPGGGEIISNRKRWNGKSF